MIDVLRTELKYSVRGLSRTPVFTLVAVLSLALGIGANTAVFSVLSGLQFRPLPYYAADRLVDVYEHHPTEVCTGCGVGTSYPTYLDIRTARSLQTAAAYRSESFTIGSSDGAERWGGAYVSASLFPLLGVQPLHGRSFTLDEDVAGGAAVVVLGERLWRARFGADPEVVGSTVRVNGEPRTIAGVMPDALAFPAFAELWLPITPMVARDTRADRNIGVIGRLQGGSSLEHARAEIAALGTQLAADHPRTNAGWSMHVASLRADMTSDYLHSFYLMLGIVAFVLLVACANLANLLLARASARRHELGVRVALGASRFALARHTLAESLLLSCTGAALGLLIAAWALDAFTAVINGALPAWVRYDMDLRVLLFASLVALLTGIGFGLLPAIQVARTQVSPALGEGARGSMGGSARTRVRNTLVAVQVAAAMVLAFGANFLVQEFLRINTFDPGHSIDGLYGAQLTLPAERYRRTGDVSALADALVQRVSAATATADVALSSFFVPNWPGTPPVEMRAEGREPAEVAAILHRVVNVTPAYFETHRIEISAGRDFRITDRAGAPRVAIVGSALAARLWPSENPLGRRIHLGAPEDDWITVVGVVPSARASPFARDTSRLLYLPLAQRGLMQPSADRLALHLRLPYEGAALPQRLREAVADIDADLVVENAMSVRQATAEWTAPVRITALVITGLGLFAVVLAAMGIYGLIAYAVTQRTPEIGLRLALGATRIGVMRLVVRQALLLAMAGLVFGSFGALGLDRVLRHQFFGAHQGGTVIMILPLVPTFLAVAAFASWLPARRAARIDPMATLRTE